MKKRTQKFCMVLLFVCLMTGNLFSEIIYVPVTLANAKKGDTLLQGSSSGMIGEVLSAAFGGYWGHSGMMIDDGETIRHNTLDIDQMALITNWLGVPTMIEPNDVENGPPGMVSDTVDDSYKGLTGWPLGRSTDVILSPDDDSESVYRPLLEEIADTFIYLEQYYRLHSYINETEEVFFDQFNNTDYLVSGKGGNCSGTILFAHYLNGLDMNIFYAPPEMINEGAFTLYDNLYDIILDAVKDAAGTFGGIFVDEEAVAEKIANQVVNAFGLDVYNDTSDTWRAFEDEIHTYATAPDHLVLNSMMNPAGTYPGIQTTETSYYGKMETHAYSGGYFIDTENDDDILVRLYSSENYENTLADYTGTGSYDLNGSLNDKALSIILHPAIEVWVYMDDGNEGRQVLLKSDCPDLYKKFNFKNKISSIKIQEKVGDGTPVVHCYNKDNFEGTDGNVTTLTVGNYKKADLLDRGQKVNTLSSIKIDHGLKVTLYDGTSYNAGDVTLRGEIPFLAGYGFDNITASMKVEYDD
ncbi:MAG: beta/gamma crystallin family protein [bacterium]|nr:beta/gamma crystallin family protein [bacterium]